MYTKDKDDKKQLINSISGAYKKNCLFYTMFDECISIENKRLCDMKEVHRKNSGKCKTKNQNRQESACLHEALKAYLVTGIISAPRKIRSESKSGKESVTSVKPPRQA